MKGDLSPMKGGGGQPVFGESEPEQFVDEKGEDLESTQELVRNREVYVAVLGMEGTGKSEIMQRYCGTQFFIREDIDALTVQKKENMDAKADIYFCETFFRKMPGDKKKQVRFIIEKKEEVRIVYDAAIFCFDITNAESYRFLKASLEHLKTLCDKEKQTPVYIVATRKDFEKSLHVKGAEISEYLTGVGTMFPQFKISICYKVDAREKASSKSVFRKLEADLLGKSYFEVQEVAKDVVLAPQEDAQDSVAAWTEKVAVQLKNVTKEEQKFAKRTLNEVEGKLDGLHEKGEKIAREVSATAKENGRNWGAVISGQKKKIRSAVRDPQKEAKDKVSDLVQNAYLIYQNLWGIDKNQEQIEARFKVLMLERPMIQEENWQSRVTVYQLELLAKATAEANPDEAMVKKVQEKLVNYYKENYTEKYRS